VPAEGSRLASGSLTANRRSCRTYGERTFGRARCPKEAAMAAISWVEVGHEAQDERWGAPARRHLRVVPGGVPQHPRTGQRSAVLSPPARVLAASMRRRPSVGQLAWRWAVVLVLVGGLGAVAFEGLRGALAGRGAVASSLSSCPAGGASSLGAAPCAAYVVKPGDTAWSIAVRYDRGADPRPLADMLESEAGGGGLQPGETVLVP
jgi:hypothetical protein